MKDLRVYTSPLLFPIDQKPLHNGAIAVNSEMILKVGPQEEVLSLFKDADIVELSGVVIPGLVNAHTHLELSYLSNIPRPGVGESMVDWIEELLDERFSNRYSDEFIVEAMNAVVKHQQKDGVVLVGDIYNISDLRAHVDTDMVDCVSLYELLAPNRQRTSESIGMLNSIPDDIAVTPHAIYSTTAQLITTLKERCAELGHVYSIHLAETQGEIDLIKNQEGVFKSFLEKRNSWDGTLIPEGDFTGCVDYLEKLGVLDHNTLLVHCVHVSNSELQCIAEAGSKICICPGSNIFLRSGLPSLYAMLENDLLPAIGTDSSASNTSLSLWEEMKIIRTQYPEVSSATVLKMATLGGAKALGKGENYGSLSAGKKPVFAEITLNNNMVLDENSVLDVLTSQGRPGTVTLHSF